MSDGSRAQPPCTIRAATPGDAAAIIEVELDAGALFRQFGMAAVADEPPPTVAEMNEHLARGWGWVAESAGALAGFVVVRLVDDEPHVAQVSTASAYARQGVGRALLDQVHTWADRLGYRRTTLTTFTDVPWNGPYYRRLGYAVVPESALGPGLAGVRATEARHGLDVWGRCAMARPL